LRLGNWGLQQGRNSTWEQEERVEPSGVVRALCVLLIVGITLPVVYFVHGMIGQ
jgi:hypothetical protein